MRLARLTLSGFKSFAKTTSFEFSAPISAIVGPNGSGKSNVAEAIRWVLGEQSLKTIRGKKGEDLIFSGSAKVPRMGKAAVTLTFNNSDRKIPVDFTEITLERKIYRDGTNEYFLNGSRVRLKDIVELLARIGLGETKHNIIGQGEVDRLLLASSRERRSMLEEAIGLRLFQLRKREAERKLEETRRNMDQAGALVREIRPHLKFLKSQADKAGEREAIRQDLARHVRVYIQTEEAGITAEAKRIRDEKLPLERDLSRRKKEIEKFAGADARDIPTEKDQTHDLDAIEKLENARREIIRELGKIEARIEDQSRGSQQGSQKFIETALVAARLFEFRETARAALSRGDLADVRERITTLVAAIERFIAELKSAPDAAAPRANHEMLIQKRDRIQKELAGLDIEIVRLRKAVAERTERAHAAEVNFRERFQKLRTLEEEAHRVRIALERLRFDEEKLRIRRDELSRVGTEYGLTRAEIEAGETIAVELTAPELRRKIDRLKARYDEIGGIDLAVVKEYEETKARADFLERELADLERASADLENLITELDERIEHEFASGFAKIQQSFQEYFQLIFGGGRGTLEYIKVNRQKPKDEHESGADGEPEDEYGIEIKVDIPRKRIKSLDMLSGGERALTSIALLFAVTAVNPPPFLILDETDAALDEANSTKYGEILKQLAKKTQLVVITHNRETMKQAGILYGVTMGEDDVSKVLSLKLEEAADYGNR